MIFEVRDLWPEMPIATGDLKNKFLIKAASTLEIIAYKNASHIICLSPGMKDGVKRRGISGDIISIVPNSSDIKYFQNDKLKKSMNLKKLLGIEGKKICLYAGSFGKINDLDYLVKIAKETYQKDNSIVFILLGEGKFKKDLIMQSKKFKILNKNLFILDSYPKKDMPSIFNSADLIFSIFKNLKPMWSNSANKFFDALAAGKPVCINYGGWHADIIRKFQVGLVIPPENYIQSSQKIIKFLNNENNKKIFSINSLNLAKSHFDRDKLFQKFESAIFKGINKYRLKKI